MYGGHNGKTEKLIAFSMRDCGYKWCVHRQMVRNDNIFVFNVNCVDAFARLFDCSKDHFNKHSLSEEGC